MTALANRARRVAASRGPRVAAALAAAALMASLTGAARQPASIYPVQAAFASPGPYATTTGTVTDAGGTVIYDVYRPNDYSALGFNSPIVTWGNGTGASPAKVSDFLSHLASYGFTVIASTLPNTGSGNEIDAAAHYLVTQNGVATSVFHGHLNTGEIASVGTSQGATGAVRAATNDPALIKAVMTFSLPNSVWSGPNPDCPTAADCTSNPAALTQPVFFISTYGFWDAIIASDHREGVLPQHLGARRARHHPHLRRQAGRPYLDPERRGRREPRRLLRLRHRLARVPAARQRHRGRRVRRPAPGAAVEHQLAGQRH